ncbi:MAG: sigma-70 family RNA polymerase sigma factor [Planctomycetales bacterium]|nr:sigma-70 family RNA polymerase sigma factor [Planctomycetales bacterium]MCA9168858.1 sigma-70 family RNA polymerase sigma factor [Planctomycetales bacterium]
MLGLKPLFESARAGDRAAFDQLFERLRLRLTAFATSRMSSDLLMRVEVDDVVQETSLKALQSITQVEWQGEGALASWFCGIAINVIYNHSRRYARIRPLQEEQLQAVNDTSPSQHVRREERFDRLNSCLAMLTDEQQQVIRYTRLEGLSIRETATRIGRTENATTQLLWRATQKLAQLFGDTASIHLPPDRKL